MSPRVNREDEVRKIRKMSANYVKKQEIEQKNRMEEEDDREKMNETTVSNVRAKLNNLEETLAQFPNKVDEDRYELEGSNKFNVTYLIRTYENKLQLKRIWDDEIRPWVCDNMNDDELEAQSHTIEYDFSRI